MSAVTVRPSCQLLRQGSPHSSPTANLRVNCTESSALLQHCAPTETNVSGGVVRLQGSLHFTVMRYSCVLLPLTARISRSSSTWNVRTSHTVINRCCGYQNSISVDWCRNKEKQEARQHVENLQWSKTTTEKSREGQLWRSVESIPPRRPSNPFLIPSNLMTNRLDGSASL